MGCRSNESDTDVWIEISTIENGNAYDNYMLVNANNALHLAKDAQKGMLNLNQVYLLEEGFGTSDRYIGANDDKIQL